MNLTVLEKTGVTTAPPKSAPTIVLDINNGVSLAITRAFQTTAAGGNADYFKYIFGALEKVDRLNEPTLLNFSLVDYDKNLVRLLRGNYISITTNTYPYFFTGYIINDPALEYLGTTKTAGVVVPVWGYKYQATDDTYILNQQPLGLMPPFINTTQGAILRALVQRIQRDKFNFGGVQNGKFVARYVVNPQDTFSSVVKEFADSSHYTFYTINNALFFEPSDVATSSLILDANDKHFTPANLSIEPSQNPIYNDAIVLGDIEPQGYMNEWFIGSGFDARFPLISSVYGVDSSLLLDEDFGDSAINTDKWTVFDTVNNWLQVSNGFLNALGGDANGSYSAYLQSASLIPMEGSLRFTHGEYDFVSASSGVVAGLWTQTPNSAFTGCLYGISCSKSGSSTVLNPIIEGVVDTTQSFTVDYTKRYVFRTIAKFANATRVTNNYAYTNASGSTGNYGGSTVADTVTYQTILVEIDISTGAVTKTINWYHTNVVLTSNEYFAYYVPLALDDLHCTVTGITISTPMQAGLKILPKESLEYVVNGAGVLGGTSDKLNFVYQTGSGNTAIIAKISNFLSSHSAALAGLMVRNGLGNNAAFAAITQAWGGGIKFITRTAVGAATSTTTVSSITSPVWLKLIQTDTYCSGFYSKDGENWIQVGTATSIEFATNLLGLMVADSNDTQLNIVSFDHVVTSDSTALWTDIDIGSPSIAGSAVSAGTMATNGVTAWVNKLVGPNEIDSIDGLSPVATIVDSNSGAVTKSSDLGSAKYNPGNAALAFFKDSTQQISTVPQPGDLLHLTYRRAGTSIARVSNLASIASEVTSWGDNGVRSITIKDLNPSPRNSKEAELAAGATVNELGYQHYQGKYSLDNTYSFGSEPKSGTILKFQNMPASFPSVQAELINEVNTVMTAINPIEHFEHTVSFGQTDRIRQLLAGFIKPSGTFQPVDTAEIPDTFDVSALGNTNVADVTSPTIVGWDATNLTFQTNQDPPSGGGFEIRYTDDSWGADNGKNLVTRTTSQTFTVPRTVRGKICFIKAYDARNLLTYSEDFTNAIWIKTSVTVTNATDFNPYNDKSQISSLAYSTSGSLYQQSGTTAASKQAVFSVSMKGTAGKQVNVILADGAGAILATTVATLTTKWKRFSVTGTFGGGATGNIRCYLTSVTASGAHTVQATNASLEIGTSTESIYCKTLSTTYGALSRFAAGVHVSFPLVPNPPDSVTVDYTDVLHPVLTINLPSVAGDIWGVEVRDSDQTTVLHHIDLTATTFVPTYAYDNSVIKTRSLSFYVYTYNLLDEFSSSYHVTATIPLPSAASFTVDEVIKTANWTGSVTTTTYKVEIDKTSSAMGDLTVNAVTADKFYQLQDSDFFPQRWFRITPQDQISDGTPITGSHIYTAAVPTLFNNTDNIFSVPAPVDTHNDPSIPTNLVPYTPEIITESWRIAKLEAVKD